jgi:hypothetical protein
MIEEERDRHIDTLMSIFDLKIQSALNLEKRVSTRVRFLYDKKRNIKQFKVLNYNMPNDINSRILAWLDDNIKDNSIIVNLTQNEMDADSKNYI